VEVEDYRRAAREQWEGSAAGWAARRDLVQRSAMPVSRWLVDAIHPQPGHTVLELAAGPGDTGFLAAELILPGGRLISSDFAEPMLEAARARAEELGVSNVEFRELDAEWLDLDTASVDGVLCRWGFMLVADPAAALREARRVLRPGGRVALAAWDAREHNPWVTAAGDELVERGLAPPVDPAAPGMFALAPPGRIAELLEGAGFAEVEVDPLDFEWRYGSFEEWWEVSLDLGRPLAVLVASRSSDEVGELRAGMRRRLEPWIGADGTLVVPARTLVATASA
jgi:ubiquinone/menaquinone biosynthesis C-methylase UbiE